MHPAKRLDSVFASTAKRSSIVFVGTRFKFCGKLIRAVETDFSHVDVELIDDVDTLCQKLSANSIEVQLLIIDSAQFAPFYDNKSLIAAAFPDKVISIACDGSGANLRESIRSLVDAGIVRGVLPMNLQLDIWLSALQLMLNGGDYIPIEIMSGASSVGVMRNGAENTAPPIDLNRASKPPTDVRAHSIGELTRREIEVLKLVAEGHQNKEIAARLKLSEHTVKLHMHHIISKLGAHNRTQAAAAYFSQFSSQA